ncbi:hypothetical protein G6F68_017671 [Rhizopus microsporus]|nr:hypothetical protein G6F68_017671 [Rhizopus microsporus]
MIENMFGQSQLRPSIPAAAAAAAPHSEAVNRILQGEQPTADALSLLQGISSAAITRRGLSGGRSHVHLAYVWAMSDDQAQVQGARARKE